MDQSNPRLLGSEGWELAMWTQSNPGSVGWELATWISLILDCWVQRSGSLLRGPV